MKRLDFILSNAGLGSRKTVSELIKTGQIQVNDNIITEPNAQISEDAEIKFNNKSIKTEKFIYIMMNKQADYVCTNFDDKRSVLHIIPPEFKRKDLFTVGRLDIDTTGLLLITNDGGFAHKIITPKKLITKIYQTNLQYPITQKDIESLKNGIQLSNNEQCKPAIIEVLAEDSKTINIYINEGKYHQVKRMIGACENRVINLKRTSIGSLKLDPKLNPGECKLLSDDEKALIFI